MISGLHICLMNFSDGPMKVFIIWDNTKMYAVSMRVWKTISDVPHIGDTISPQHHPSRDVHEQCHSCGRSLWSLHRLSAELLHQVSCGHIHHVHQPLWPHRDWHRLRILQPLRGDIRCIPSVTIMRHNHFLNRICQPSTGVKLVCDIAITFSIVFRMALTLYVQTEFHYFSTFWQVGEATCILQTYGQLIPSLSHKEVWVKCAIETRWPGPHSSTSCARILPRMIMASPGR